MKCKVCGRELDPTKSYCDKCGSPVDLSDSKDTGEFSWNTLDFPKPKKPKDIEMSWPDMNRKGNYMSGDATEGFVPSAGGFTSPQPRAAETPKPQPAVQNVQPGVQAQSFVPPQGFAQPQGFVHQVQQPVQQPQMSWTMPMNAWSVPSQQQVAVPQPYGVSQPVQGFVQPQPAVPVQQSFVSPQTAPQSFHENFRNGSLLGILLRT